MAVNVTLASVQNLNNQPSALGAINGNSTAITNAFLDVVSRSGVTPNQMNAELDMNNNRIINLPAPIGLSDPLRLRDAATPVQIQVLTTATAVTKNFVYAGPVSGTNANPNFRALVPADFNGGVSASSSTFWRGDGVWSAPVTIAAGSGITVAQSGNSFTISFSGSTGVSGGCESCATYGYSGQTPWLIYGGVAITAGSPVINPAAATNGLLGEASFPYTVPVGKVLFVDVFCVEPLGGVQCIPFISPNATLNASPINSLDTFTVGAGPATTAVSNFNLALSSGEFKCGYKIPAGLTLNLWMSNLDSNFNGSQFEYSIKGFLCNAS